ncbi:DHHC palmitoyltransferase-domain-containing protein [Mycotypha africana]|uniref:DHHC palmitoyltransferase-domain-containing protein n=1 Tax=Mycotypha africana TaxID=64632 RepID=UPI002301166A|nr:DHHC palmitoyltransferase-domain-containing protein [Mycotypha africana]KAI8967506.1 DHHC palmitoyltransferase-domain-containing protein [Mycotypha africana]
MNLIISLLIFLSIFGLIVFALLFGESPSLRNGFIGKLNHFLTASLPTTINWLLQHTIGLKNTARLDRLWAYCCESRNPFLQIFFVGLSSLSIILFLYNALPHMPGPYVHKVHVYFIIPVQIIAIYLVYYLACTVDPGFLTKENLKQHLDYYKYDGLIFKSDKICSTCKLQKPARSKHCSLCKGCIGKMDHHCAWINQCVGENNQRYFFYFLFILIEFCTYGAYLSFQIYRGMIIEWGLDQAFEQDKLTGEHKRLTFRRAFLYVLHRDRIIGAIGILAIVVATVVFCFTVYQLYLAGRGITTNEAFKWEMIEEAIDRGEIYKVVRVPASSSSLSDNNIPSKVTSLNDTYVKKYHKNVKKNDYIKQERKVESFDEIENIYDKGFFNNLKEVFNPPKLV